MWIIDGGQSISGVVKPGHFKHSFVLILAHALARSGPTLIHGIPDVTDGHVLPRVVQSLGRDVSLENGSLHIKAGRLGRTALPAAADAVHGSLYLSLAQLVNAGSAEIRRYGGCQLLSTHGRPWRHFVDLARIFGAGAEVVSDNSIRLSSSYLVGAEVDLSVYAAYQSRDGGPAHSSATKAAILLAASAHGPSILRAPYLKAEIEELLRFLLATGVDAAWSEHQISIGGISEDNAEGFATFTVGPDLIEVTTWSAIAAATRGEIEILLDDQQAVTRSLSAEFKWLASVGVALTNREHALVIHGADFGGYEAPEIHSTPSSIYSDSQPLLGALAALCPGMTLVREDVWPERFAYLEVVRAMRGEACAGSKACLVGTIPARGPTVSYRAPDLRAAASALILMLSRPGSHRLEGEAHLERGYSNLLPRLQALGLRARKVEGNDSNRNHRGGFSSCSI